jgi:two-component system phosphate regulon sensor histidine kinase PhoR
MRNRIRFIILLMIISIPAIIGMQMVWVFNSYKINKKQLEKEINEALESTIHEEYEQRMNNFAEIKADSTGKVQISSTEILNDEKLDSLFIQLQESQGSSAEGSYTLNLSSGDIDSNDSLIPEIPDNFDVDIKGILKSMIASELAMSIETRQQILDSVFSVEITSRNISGTFTLELIEDSTLFKNNHKAIVSRIFSISLTNSLFVRAVFSSKYQIILQRMIGIMSLSFIIILIAVISFVYMLLTILRQKKLSEIKNDFINNMTHELKTPIATVSTAIEAMLSFGALNDPEKSKNYLNISYNELQRLSGLIEKVLNVSRLERNTIELYKEKINAIEIFDQIAERYQNGTEKKVQFAKVSENNNFTINADRTHFTNIMNNLIDNAVKYSGDAVEITMKCKTENNHCIISLKDNGIGISKDHQKKIFDKFFRVPSGDLHNVKGFGLGLHYVYNIIHQHGGEIEVKSTIGKGSEFIIKLPDYK